MANGKNVNWIKVGTLSAIGGLIIVLITIFGFAKSAVDERIDVKLLAHEAATESEHRQDISEIKKDIAVMKEQNKRTSEDIKEIKELLKDAR